MSNHTKFKSNYKELVLYHFKNDFDNSEIIEVQNFVGNAQIEKYSDITYYWFSKSMSDKDMATDSMEFKSDEEFYEYVIKQIKILNVS